MALTDLTMDVFLILREAFFNSDRSPKPFALRDKRSTQDDPLDEYVAAILAQNLSDATCQRSPGPLISPDMVVFRSEYCEQANREVLRTDLSRIVGIEVKKLERSRSGQVARSTGMDYNTTPPCGTVRVYDADNIALDIPGFYLFVCQETASDGRKVLTALALCGGQGIFYIYRQKEDVPEGWEPEHLVDPFPKPIRRVAGTQVRGKFRLPIRPVPTSESDV